MAEIHEPAERNDTVLSSTAEGSPISEERHAAEPRGLASLPLGARLTDDRTTEFRVWAPDRQSVELHIVSPAERRIALTRHADGYHDAVVDCGAGTRYFFTVGGNDRPDPASRLQPDGVHGPSEVVPAAFDWHDRDWHGLPLADYVVYELHVGTFTPEGTFEAVIPHLDALRDLGITVIELLPVAQFPGERNWGYDGVFVAAAQNSYGGPTGLKRLVDACHTRGLAVALDVVFNHLGPEGNYLSEYGPYFTERYKTPWGPALNFDGARSDDVRWFFIHAALQWVDEFHVDALRVDAVHAIIDHTAEPFLQDLTAAVRARAAQLGRTIITIAESDLNDPRVITPKERLGLGFDTQWSDDFHHSLHALMTGEDSGYYNGFGRVSDLAQAIRRGFVYVGQHSAFRARKYGLDPKTGDGTKFVVCAQNHDQIGNRMFGDRLSTLVPWDKLKLAAAAVILSPFVPMIFMGEEYGEKAPFQYFTSHSDDELIEAVRKGRRDEFHEFAWQGEAPDPHEPDTFERSKLRWEALEREEHRMVRSLYRELLRLRRETPAIRNLDLYRVRTHADEDRRLLLLERSTDDSRALIAFNFGDTAQSCELPFAATSWRALIDTGAKIENGTITLPPSSFALFGAAPDQG